MVVSRRALFVTPWILLISSFVTSCSAPSKLAPADSSSQCAINEQTSGDIQHVGLADFVLPASGVAYRREASGYSHCFPQSRDGAADTAVIFLAQSTSTQLHKAVLNGTVLPGISQSRFAGLRPEGASAEAAVVLRAYKFASYSNSSSLVRVVAALPDGSLLSIPVYLQWVAKDWRVDLAKDPQTAGATQISTLEGYEILY